MDNGLNSTQEHKKNSGAFYTPSKVAEFLAEWAIHSNTDTVLDPGSGEGIFMKYAFDRLAKLGGNKKYISSKIYGIEYDKYIYRKLKNNFKGFNVIHSNFFDILPSKNPNGKNNIPFVDAVIGNPPYIERERMKEIDSIRKNLLESTKINLPLHLVTDIYGYFLIHSTHFLKNGGRLAFIISDSWMNMDFGKYLKKLLLEYYKIKAIVSFEERVFSNALVHTALILAEKSRESEKNVVQFVRLKNYHDLEKLGKILNQEKPTNNEIKIMKIKQSKLDSSDPWSIYLKGSKPHFEIISNSLIVPMRSIANVGIGVQSLKNEFYILDKNKAKKLGLEKIFLAEIIMSPRDSPLIIENKNLTSKFILYCNKPYSEIKNTKLLKYIRNGEKIEVSQRGSNKKITGYQNILRIQQAKRNPWYNLIPEIEKRCRASIILPRRSFTRFFAAWNKAKVVVNDNFINVEPKDQHHILPLLAILNSSLTEYLCRVRSQTYGAGVNDLRPDDVKNLPTLNLSLLPKEKLRKLSNAYTKFIESDGDRTKIDSIIREILKMSETNWNKLTKGQDELRLLASISNHTNKH